VRVRCLQKALKMELHVGECSATLGLRHGVTSTG
jgi:hypothetical protein